MSHQLRSHSADLAKLQDEGFDFVISHGRLVVREIPYLNSANEVCWGALACPLNNDGESTTQPTDHTMMFAGEVPHDEQGNSLHSKLIAGDLNEQFEGHHFRYTLSRMPQRQHYVDYYEKVITYCTYLCRPAEQRDSSAVPYRHNPITTDPDSDEPFQYMDTNAARGHTIDVNDRFSGMRIGIVGVGGTGSYVLDLVSKCRVQQIKIFDGDTFKDHNAFRAPGAASIEDLKSRKSKVEYLAERYSRMHKGIVPIPTYIIESNLGELDGLDFVFLCMDASSVKATIIGHLQQAGIPFVDSGIGIHRQSTGLAGLIRVTAVNKETPARFVNRIPVSDGGDDDLYATNIQVAEINCMAAVLSVMSWKRHIGFYDDLERAPQGVYVIDGNIIINSGGASAA